MHSATLGSFVILALVSAAAGCQGQDKAETSPEVTRAAAQSPGATKGNAAPGASGAHGAAPTPGSPATAAALGGAAAAATPTTGYDLTAIKTIPDSCTTAAVVLASAPKSVGSSYEWSTSRQALLANQQFRVTTQPSPAAGEVFLAPYEMSGGYALVARCGDGATCNQLAAMYKAIVRSSRPQVICGPVQGLGAKVASFPLIDPTTDLPKPQNAAASCARLNACQIATDRSTPGDPFLECQKAPHKFKLDCASRYPCAEVLACLQH
ncbi:hypothetical protein [Chondromyces apiculatus]|uniref:Secreted protein n=1 Tax=Chondromyces apiculatus DSM 436 TaxID=1192034 RepID=A0A017SWB2_9BACT|nr:hypothetical protein [Chondromyces apiculatus]EYF01264.1 Hypothetical protein CAP_8517 [Chondromyces apiculatus DSM 436]